MPVVLTGTLGAVARDVGNGSCRCLRLHNNHLRPPVEPSPRSAALCGYPTAEHELGATRTIIMISSRVIARFLDNNGREIPIREVTFLARKLSVVIGVMDHRDPPQDQFVLVSSMRRALRSAGVFHNVSVITIPYRTAAVVELQQLLRNTPRSGGGAVVLCLSKDIADEVIRLLAGEVVEPADPTPDGTTQSSPLVLALSERYGLIVRAESVEDLSELSSGYNDDGLLG